MHFPNGALCTSLRSITIGTRFQIRLEDRLQHDLGCGLHHSVPDSRDGQDELHWTTARIWDGRRSVTRSIHCEASASKYSRGDAYRVSILLSSVSWRAAVSASRSNGRTGPIRLGTTRSASHRIDWRATRFSNWSPY